MFQAGTHPDSKLQPEGLVALRQVAKGATKSAKAWVEAALAPVGGKCGGSDAKAQGKVGPSGAGTPPELVPHHQIATHLGFPQAIIRDREDY